MNERSRRAILNPDSMKPQGSWMAQIGAILGTIRDVVRGIQVGYLGPTIMLEETFTIAANTVQQFTMTVPVTCGIDWWTCSFSTVTMFLDSLSIGAVEYYSKRGLAIQPTFPPFAQPMFQRGLLRRIEMIQGDTIVITVANQGGAPATATLWVEAYRLGRDECA